MMEEERAGFGILNYVIFSATLLISFGIGMGTAFRGNKSPEEFLLGNRSFGVVPVAMSLIISMISAINLIGYTVEIYAHGMQLSISIVGGVVGIIVASVLTLPVICPLKLISVHEYIELRFKSPQLRFCMMLLILIQATIFMGVCLYAPSIALTGVTPLDYTTYIYIMGVICTIYSTVGGIRAVIWTDVFQFTVIIIGMIAVLIAGTIEAGGVGRILAIANEGGRLDMFNLNPSLYERHNVYNTFAFGVFFYSAIFGISQINTQRICAVSSTKKARKVLYLTAIGMLVIHAMIFAVGLITYAVYVGCDPTMDGKIPKKDAILSYFIVDKLSFIPGLPGIFVAILVSSTLSTFSSILNAQVAIVWKDCLSKFSFFANATPRTAALVNKILTFLIGSGFIAMALIISKAGSMIQLVLTVGGMIFGCIYGVFILGMCFPQCNAKGAWSGLIVSYLFILWIYVGSIVYGKSPEPLPLSTESCVSIGNSSTLDVTNSVYEILTNQTNDSQLRQNSTSSQSFSSPFMYLYGISYTLYPVMSPLICIIVGIIASYITGPQKIKEVPQELITPFMRRFYPEIGKDVKIEMAQLEAFKK